MKVYTGLHDVEALCLTCNKEWTTKNAQGVAAIHARKYHHKVSVTITQGVTYDGTEEGEQK